jgi:glycosidase
MKKKTISTLMAISLLLTACSSTGTTPVQTMTQSIENQTDMGAEASETTQTADATQVNADSTDIADATEGTDQTEGAAAPEAIESQAPDFMKSAVLYEVNLRQYTESGTINEFSEHLDTLKEMGINTLWFMPIHPISVTNRSGKLGSYYSVSDYRDVNPEFGTREDFKALVDKAHEMGFKVILDWVANHTGWDNAWITEHPDWYTQKDGKIISPEGMGWPDVADLNYDNKELRQEMIDCMLYWVTEFDVDGFRCDYAPGVPADFWEEARTELDKVKDIYMLEEDLGGVAEANLNYAFDSNYATKVYETLMAVGKDSKTADKLKLYIPKAGNNTFPMYYLDNHDVNSYDRTIAEAFSEDVMPSMYSLIFTLPGVPMIYSGDEIAYDKAIAFMEKDTIDWDRTGSDYRDLIRSLSDIKTGHPSLNSDNTGDGFEIVDTGNKNIFAFKRVIDGDEVTCIYNLSKREQSDVDLSGILSGDEEVLFSGKASEYSEGGELPETVHTFEPWEFYITGA